MRKLTLFLLTAGAVALGAASVSMGGKAPAPTGGLLPDMRTVVPAHLQLVNEHQRETLRFSNGIANTGPGPWALRPDPPVAEATSATWRSSRFARAARPGRSSAATRSRRRSA